MAISDKLLQVNQVKQDIKEAIENKGVDLTGVDFGGYAGKIDELPLPKEEQTKTVTEPNFSSGNVVVTPDTGKVLTQVTVVKDNDLIPENIVKDVSIFGVVGTAETGGGASGEGDILYYGTGLDGTSSPYYTIQGNGAIVMFHVNNIQQDFPSIGAPRGLFIVNDGTNTTIGQGYYYNKPDGSSMGVISNAYVTIFSNGLIILKFDTSVAPPVVELTQAQYDALSVYDGNTYYLIVEE